MAISRQVRYWVRIIYILRSAEVLWTLILVLFFPFIFAKETQLQPILIEASKDLERFSFSVENQISTKDLVTQPMGTLIPELEKIPGVVVIQNGGPGGRVSLFIRGSEARHVSFSLDGLRLNDTSNTDRQFDSAFMTLPFLKKVQVFKGPQAVLYGSDAMGGLVEMTTRKGENAPETRVSLNGGSFGTVGLNLSQDWKNKNHQGTLTLSRQQSDGISRLNKKRFQAKERDSSDVTQLTSSSTHLLGDKTKTEFLANYLFSRAEQDGADSDNNHDHSQNAQYVLQQKTNYQLAHNQSLSLRNGLSRHQRQNISLVTGEDDFSGDFFQHELLHQYESQSLSLVSGLSIQEESAQFQNFDTSFLLTSLFLQAALEKNNFKAHAGIRGETHSEYGDFFTGAFGVKVKKFFIQYSQGFKTPSLYQLYGPAIFGSPVGNPALQPETNQYLEAGWKEEHEDWSLLVSMFQNRLENLFTYSFSEGYFNQEGFISEGVEIGGEWRLTNYQLISSYTHQIFKNEDSVVLRRPRNSFQFGINWFPEETLELSGQVLFFSARQDRAESGVVKLNPYEVVNLGVRKSWGNNDFSLQLKNVLNRDYEDIYGFSVLPRSVFMSLGHYF